MTTIRIGRRTRGSVFERARKRKDAIEMDQKIFERMGIAEDAALKRGYLHARMRISIAKEELT